MHDLFLDLAVSEATRDAKLFEVHENMDFTSPISIRWLNLLFIKISSTMTFLNACIIHNLDLWSHLIEL